MNWDAIGAIGEAFSAIGLFFVLLQVRHARTDMRQSVLNGQSDSLISVQSLASDSRVLTALTKVEAALGRGPATFTSTLMEKAGLTEEEARLVNLHQMALWQAMLKGIRCQEVLKPADRIGVETNLRRIYGESPLGRLFYEAAKPTMNPDVSRYMTRVLADAHK